MNIFSISRNIISVWFSLAIINWILSISITQSLLNDWQDSNSFLFSKEKYTLTINFSMSDLVLISHIQLFLSLTWIINCFFKTQLSLLKNLWVSIHLSWEIWSGIIVKYIFWKEQVCLLLVEKTYYDSSTSAFGILLLSWFAVADSTTFTFWLNLLNENFRAHFLK